MLAELDRVKPAVILIEGPADADPLLALAATRACARRSRCWPTPRTRRGCPRSGRSRVFSPEWQALRWAADHQVPVRFCDLPASMVLAADPRREDSRRGRPAATRTEPETMLPVRTAQLTAAKATAGQPGSAAPAGEDQVREDPIGALAAAAGYDDPERWWDDVIESRLDGQPPFDALTEAMAELRARQPPRRRPRQRQEDRREAHMRQVLRAALKQADGTVAVVCGAWHAPALAGKLPPASADAALLRGARRRKTALTWVPWTHSRLAAASGYGAGITSPGWYHHLFTAADHPVARWLTQVAGVLRARDLPVSSAHVIEAVRLAEALAALRGRPLAGLAEVSEATRSVLCERRRGSGRVRDPPTWCVGERLGTVPDSAAGGAAGGRPAGAGQDAAAEDRPAGPRPSPWTCARTLDRGRSVLLHRLAHPRHRLGERHRRHRAVHRDVPRDLGAALAARAGRRDHRRGAVGHDGGRGRRGPDHRRGPDRPASWPAVTAAVESVAAGRPARRAARGAAPRWTRRPPATGTSAA